MADKNIDNKDNIKDSHEDNPRESLSILVNGLKKIVRNQGRSNLIYKREIEDLLKSIENGKK
jgi:hypothetical protein